MNSLRNDCSLGSINDGVKALRVRYSNLAQHFTVQTYFGFFTSIDELAVSNIALPTGSAQANNPETSKIAFSAFSVYPRIYSRSDRSFLGLAIKVAPAATITLYRLEKPSLCFTPCGSLSNSWHFADLLSCENPKSYLLTAANVKPRSKRIILFISYRA
jgi:hypothetical protein